MYITQREKITNFIEKQVIPAIKKSQKDPDYNLLLSSISENCMCSGQLAEEVLREFFARKKLKEVRYVTLADEELTGWLKELQEEKKRIEQEADKLMQDFKGERK